VNAAVVAEGDSSGRPAALIFPHDVVADNETLAIPAQPALVHLAVTAVDAGSSIVESFEHQKVTG
jgi:hypothetical protein